MSAPRDFLLRPPLRAVFLDLDNTLADETAHMRCAYTAALRDVSDRISEPTAGAVVEHYLLIADDLSRRDAWDEIARLGRVELALERAGVGDSNLAALIVAGYDRHYYEGVRLLAGAGRLLEAASAFPTCLITNGSSDRQRGKIDRLGLDGRLRHVLVSGEFGASKPDAAIFARALELTGASPKDAVMVGDSIHADIAGAARAGVRSIWINPLGLPVPDGLAHPDAVVSGPAEAAAFIERAARADGGPTSA